jgi:hypothetical protein
MNESFELFTFPIWRSLCRRLSLSASIERSNDRFIQQNSSVVCSFAETSNLNGIISYLTKKFGGNLIDSDFVTITASSIGNPQIYPLQQVVDFKSRRFFFTKDEANSWICYHFKNMLVKVNQYSIRTCCEDNSNHLRSWILEGSKDGLKWVKIDDRINDTSLNSKGAIATFAVSEECQQEFQMIRLRQTGKTSNGYDVLRVSAIEFFGVLKEVNE